MREKGLEVAEKSRPSRGRGQQVMKEEARHGKVTKFSSNNKVCSYRTRRDLEFSDCGSTCAEKNWGSLQCSCSSIDEGRFFTSNVQQKISDIKHQEL